MNKYEWVEPWYDELNKCESYPAFMEVLERMKASHPLDEYLFKYIFFRYAFENIHSVPRFQVLMEYVCNQGFFLDTLPYWFVYSMCMIYDPDMVYNAFTYKITSPGNRSRKKRMLRDYIEDLKRGNLVYAMTNGYSMKFQCYYVCIYEKASLSENRNDYHKHMQILRYFKSKDEYKACIKAGISGTGISFIPRIEETASTVNQKRILKEQRPFIITESDMEKDLLENEKKQDLIVYEDTDLTPFYNNLEFWKDNAVIYYVSDIHFVFKFEPSTTKEEKFRYVEDVAKQIQEDSYHFYYKVVIIITGDIAVDFELYKYFISCLKKHQIKTIITLGNHELWSWQGKSLEEIKRIYESIIDDQNVMLLQNDLCFLTGRLEMIKIRSEDLLNKSISELETDIARARIVFFGGIGFDRGNKQNWFQGTVSVQESQAEADLFEQLYNKVRLISKDRSLVICSHMPKRSWDSQDSCPDKVAFIYGHTHGKERYDDGSVRIFADNQIGYKNKKIALKSFSLTKEYDLFRDYEDGIHELTKDQYSQFMSGKCENITVDASRVKEPIYMLKKSGFYMFMYRNKKGELLMLQGGKGRKVSISDINYYWNNMLAQVKHYDKTLEYRNYQKIIAQEVKSFGGRGTIHGCIIDINFFCHLYVVPDPGNRYPIVPYFAESTMSRTVYYPENGQDGLSRLLGCYTDLLPRYLEQKHSRQEKNELVLTDNALATRRYCEEFERKGENFYGASVKMKKLQRLEKGILQSWNELYVENYLHY